MNYEDFKEVIHGRRSVRKFTDQEVSTNDIKEIIDCARYAPSDTNSQTWEFLVIMNREKIKEIEQMTWDALHKLAKAKRKWRRESREITYTFFHHMQQLSRRHQY